MDIVNRALLHMRQYLAESELVHHAASTIDTVLKVELPPATKENVLRHYLPVQGLVSYTALSVSVMNPEYMVRIFPKKDYTNVLLLSAGTGAGLWLWYRPHFDVVTPSRRFTWSVVGATVWSLGSILLWAILRRTMGRNVVVNTFLGLATGLTITSSAVDYFQYVDAIIPTMSHSPDDTNPSDDEKYIDNDLDL